MSARPYLPPAWRCDGCSGRYLMDVAAEACDRCERVLCPSCIVAETGRCEPCDAQLHLSDEDVIEILRAEPGLAAYQVAERARTAAHNARVNERDLTRFIPRGRWYLDRAKAVIAELLAEGYVDCAHGGHRRRDDVGPLCEWRLSDRGAREFPKAVGA